MTDEVNALAAEYFDYLLQAWPTWGHIMGNYQHADRFDDASRAGEDEEIAANGGPPTTPSLRAMLRAWTEVTADADAWLDRLANADLVESLPGPGPRRTIGSALQRVTYHYWFHTGEILAIRQVLGHGRLPEFVGNIDDQAPYRAG
jgi:hypothetical protein